MEGKYPEPTVGALILNDKGEILLAKSVKWKDKYTVPGGHIELGESIKEALKREIKEEVGLDITPVKFLILQEAVYPEEFHKPKHFVFIDYLCKAESSDVKLDNKEMQKYIWIKPEDSLKLNITSFARTLINKYLEVR